MIHLAYDGSINGDWIAWYALNLARHDANRRLVIVHVHTERTPAPEIIDKLDILDGECARAGVVMERVFQTCPSISPESVSRVLTDTIPPGPDTLLVCGIRLKSGRGGYLSGTVSEKLLRDRRFAVMAVRVVQPGLLGAPSGFLMPVAGDRQGFLMGAGILKHFGPSVQHVHLLRVMQLKRHLFRRLDDGQVEHLREKGWTVMHGLGEQLADIVGIDAWKTDVHVSVSDDWAQDVIIAAGRYKTHLILMEAPQHDLGAGYLYGNDLEVVLRNAPCDVAIYRGIVT